MDHVFWGYAGCVCNTDTMHQLASQKTKPPWNQVFQLQLLEGSLQVPAALTSFLIAAS